MIDNRLPDRGFGGRIPGPASSVGTAGLTAILDVLSSATVNARGDADRIDQIRLLEQIKAAAAAVQASVTAAFVDSQRERQTRRGVPDDEVGRAIAAQVGFAQRDSHTRARRYVGWVKILTSELPHTYAALRRGETTERRALVVARETLWLSAGQRAAVDTELAPRLSGLGDRQVEAEARRLAYRLDPAGATARIARAETDRRVTLRPAPDTMTKLTALLPVTCGVAAYAALTRAADTARAAGDRRTRGQVMADTLVEAVTGQASADAVPVEIQLIMTEQTLLATDTAKGAVRPSLSGPRRTARGTSTIHPATIDPAAQDDLRHEPADILGAGVIPAPYARRLIRDTAGDVWLRRLYTDPSSGQLVAMDSRRRVFDAGLRRLLILRDRYCRHPWCGAPIRHVDHVLGSAAGGPTARINGQGLCEACNYAKQALGWTARTARDATVITTTPTGHIYRTRPPPLPGDRGR